MADALAALTSGALRRVFGGEELGEPVVQCLQIRPMNSTDGMERFRVVLSDSTNFIRGMLAQQINELVTGGSLKKGKLMKLKSYQANLAKEKPIFIIIEAEVLEQYGELEKLSAGPDLPAALDVQKAEPQEDVKPQPGNITSTNFYGQKPAPQAQPQQRVLPSRSSAPSNGGSHGNLYPIESLSPYAHKWTIKARCTHKGDIKTWHNKNGEGKLFSANFLDESGEIRATGFNDAVDQWYEVLQEGGVYYVSSPCRVQLAKKQFSNVNNDYELTFEKDTVIEKAEDMDGVPQVRYNFTTIADLQSVEKDTTIDTIGVLQDVGEVSEIVSKTTSKPYSKRELTLVDNTGYNVRLTIWGASAQTFEAHPESVLAFKGVKVSDFGGRSLSLLSSGSMAIDPDIDEAHKLKGWYDAQGRNDTFQSHINTMSTIGASAGGKKDENKTIAQIRDENLGMSDDTDWFSVKATVIYTKQDNISYPACSSENCNKKVVEINPGEWRCEKCDKTWEKAQHRFILSINVSDHTGQIWLSCFDDVARLIMGMTADELFELKENGEDTQVRDVFSEANCKTYVFRCKAKMDNFQDQQRVRYQVQYANPLNFSVEAKKLADIIKQYNIQDDSLFVR